ncbi:unannotated protein [freshwater metagenome]|uniref:Unannotated protein n=1 Tax=freshwater metagenome TaxID=449393 RepID=A0A6J7P5B6_9ZZZZ
MAQAGIEQGLGADDVREEELLRAGDRSVDVGLGREVHDDVVPGEDGVEERAVADIALDE